MKNKIFLSRLFLFVIFLFLFIPICNLSASQEASHDDAHSEHAVAHGQRWVATDTYRVINFSVLAIGLFLLVRKPAANALNSRIKQIKEELEDLEAQKKEAENQILEYESKIDAFKKESEKIVEDYKRQGLESKNSIVEKAKEEAAKFEEQAKKNIANEFKFAQEKLENEVFNKAFKEAEKLIKSKINEEDQKKLIEEYLGQIKIKQQ